MAKTKKQLINIGMINLIAIPLYLSRLMIRRLCIHGNLRKSVKILFLYDIKSRFFNCTLRKWNFYFSD